MLLVYYNSKAKSTVCDRCWKWIKEIQCKTKKNIQILGMNQPILIFYFILVFYTIEWSKNNDVSSEQTQTDDEMGVNFLCNFL